jgi:hypothetical protein
MNTNQKAPGTAKKYWRYLKIAGIATSVLYALFFIVMMYLDSSGQKELAHTMRGYMWPGLIILSIPAIYLRRKMGAGYGRGGEDEAVVAESFSEIVNSGSVVDSITTNGYIGHLFYKLTVDVYPAGFIAYGDKLPKYPVRAEEITEISYQEEANSSGLEIRHKAPGVDSPIFLGGVTLDSQFGVKLTNLAGPFKVKWAQPVY